MNPNLQNDLIEFKAWYQYRIDIIDKIIKAALEDPAFDAHELAQLRRAKLILIEKAARQIVDVYAKYGFYPDL
mgnify:CR=1 FL=1